MIDGYAALVHHFLNVPRAQRISDVPAPQFSMISNG